MNEASFKTLIKKSIKRCKGFSLSLAAPMIVGVPDLFVILPGYLPLLLEAKWLGEIKRDKFSRKVPFTEMQINWIKECDSVAPYSAMGLIGYYYHDNLYAALTKYGTPIFYNFSNTFLTDCSYVIQSGSDKLFDMQLLFAKVPIPRITPTIQMGHEDIRYGAEDKLAV